MTAPTTSSLTLKDDLSDAFTFDSAANALINCILRRQVVVATPWTSSLSSLRGVQAQDLIVVLSSTVKPYEATTTAVTAISFVDGPYLDPPQSSGADEGGTVSAYTGSVTFTPDASTFTASDVGRHIRLYHEPDAWDSGTTYANGDTATYNGEWWRSTAAGSYASSNVGIIPGTVGYVAGAAVTLWVPAPDAGRWAWGIITAQAGTSCTVDLQTGLNSENSLTIVRWRLGVFTASQYPTCGLYQDGRLWLAGAVPNRIDVSSTDDLYTFSPTDTNGLVNDNNAIEMVLNFNRQQTIHWLMPTRAGVVIGTTGGEILISSESGGVTPFDRDAKTVSEIRSADVAAVSLGTSIAFVQSSERELIDYYPRPYGQTFAGEVINENCKHLSVSLIQELTYQQEPVPIIWYRSFTGGLFGVTYRRTDNKLVKGGHRHLLTDGGLYVASMCAAPGVNEDLSSAGPSSDLVYLCTYSLQDGYAPASGSSGGREFSVEVLRPPFREVEYS